MLNLKNRVGLGSTMPFLPYGDRWRQQRRLLQRHFDPQYMQRVRSIQQHQVELLLQSLLQSPESFMSLVKEY